MSSHPFRVCNYLGNVFERFPFRKECPAFGRLNRQARIGQGSHECLEFAIFEVLLTYGIPQQVKEILITRFRHHERLGCLPVAFLVPLNRPSTFPSAAGQ